MITLNSGYIYKKKIRKKRQAEEPICYFTDKPFSFYFSLLFFFDALCGETVSASAPDDAVSPRAAPVRPNTAKVAAVGAEEDGGAVGVVGGGRRNARDRRPRAATWALRDPPRKHSQQAPQAAQRTIHAPNSPRS